MYNSIFREQLECDQCIHFDWNQTKNRNGDFSIVHHVKIRLGCKF